MSLARFVWQARPLGLPSYASLTLAREMTTMCNPLIKQ